MDVKESYLTCYLKHAIKFQNSSLQSTKSKTCEHLLHVQGQNCRFDRTLNPVLQNH
ncbi:hypothetical protein HanIR_Chr03g0131391 [Helianthus annuus]|nr:hypothetical protein HanIR_Chr03g0131391 [Helianthus annuus]